MGKVKDFVNNPQAVETVAKNVFKLADADKNGFISLNELEMLTKFIASECGSDTPSREDVFSVMRALDTNTDSKLSFEEFVPFVQEVLEVIASSGV